MFLIHDFKLNMTQPSTSHKLSRRNALAGSAALAAMAISNPLQAATPKKYKISLAEWSLNRRIFEKDGYPKLDHLDFPKVTRSLGIEACEYVSTCFADKEAKTPYLAELKTRAAGEGITNVLIMVDREGTFGDPKPEKRAEAIENHKKWLNAAAYLGCHSIRVNAHSVGTREEQLGHLTTGFKAMCDVADSYNLNVIIENHGGLSSDGEFVAQLIKNVNHKRIGTLPDFGNFYDYSTKKLTDPYKGIEFMLPYAKAVSAKAYDFAEGSKTVMEHHKFKYQIDFKRCMDLVFASNYEGFIGIEYEGANPERKEETSILKVKALIEELIAKQA